MVNFFSVFRPKLCSNWFNASSKRAYNKINQIAYGEALLAQENLSETLFKLPNVVSIGVRQHPNDPSNYYVKVGVISSLCSSTLKIPSEYVIQSAEGGSKPKSVPILTEVTGEIRTQ